MTTPIPGPPLDVHTEMYLAGAWVDVSQYVYQRQVMQLSRGRTSETDTVQPGSCKLVLDNRTGNFSPRNPNSPYFGQFGRNTPIRVTVRQFNDTFTRSVSGGWGTTDSGSVWSTDGNGGTVSASNFNTNGVAGTIQVPVANAWRGTFFTSTTIDQMVDMDAKVDFSVPFNSPTGGNVAGGVLLRYSNSLHMGYLVTAVVPTVGAIVLTIYRIDSSSSITSLASLTTTVTNVANTSVTVRGQIEDQTLRAKVWVTSAGEPKDWMLTATDATYGGAAFPGVRADVFASNTNVPVTFTFDNFDCRHIRFRGEVSAYPQTWDQSGKDITINLEAAGALRRLNQGTPPAFSAPRLWIPLQSPVAYWPLEDLGTLTRAGQPLVGNNPFNSLGNTIQKWGQGNLAPWLAPTVQGFSLDATKPDGKFLGVLPTGVNDRVTVDWMIVGASNAQQMTIAPSTTYGDPHGWSIATSASSGNVQFSPPSDATSGSVVIQVLIFSNDMYHFRFKVIDQGGGNNFWAVWINGALINSGTATGPGIGFFSRPPVAIVYDSISGTGAGVGMTFGHVAVYYGDGPDLTTAVNVARGYPGEAAGNRISRLCSQSGIPFTNVGNLAATKPMGPQETTDLLTLLTEATVADGGILYEARGDLALTYRPLTAIYNETVAATLAVNASHNLSGPLAPTDDDRFVKNDVTITRTGGAAQRITQPSGTLGTALPPAGVGAYTDSATVNVLFDSDALQLAAWRALGLGTWDEARYPALKTNFLTLPLSLRSAVASLNTGQRLQITNPESWLPPDVIDLLVQGTTENLSRFQWDMTVTASPFGPYRVGIFDSATQGLLDTAGSQLSGGPYTPTATSLTVATTSGPIWIQGAVNFDIRVAGERMTVTNISGASSPQTFTVIRSVNGISKTQTSGTAVSLWQPFRLSY